MTQDPRRDIEPPEAAGSGGARWELLLGHNLEQGYELFAELHFVFSGVLSDEVIERLDGTRRWMSARLARLGVPSMIVEAADHALANVRRWTQPSVFTDPDLNRTRRAIRDTFELLMQLTRAHLEPSRRRYYDFGVMLRRINALTVMDRDTPALPPDVHLRWPGLTERYRAELWRTCAELASFVRDEGPDNRPDPALAELDAAFRDLADYLEVRSTGDSQTDDEFLERLQAISFAAGLAFSAKAALADPDVNGIPPR
jgi:hypothetical protein